VNVPRRPAPILFAHYGEEWIRGSERCLLDLLTHLDRRRFAPVVWCNADTLARAVRGLDVPVEVSPFSILFDWQPPRYRFGRYLRLVRTGARLVRQYGIRLLHSNSVAPTQWLFPVARQARIPLVTHIHAPYVQRERLTLGLHQATVAVGVTRGCLDGLLADGFPEARTATIYNAVDLSGWDRWNLRSWRTELGFGPEDVVLAQAGSLIHRKGHDILLRAFRDLHQARPQCRLLIVGDGPDRPGIEAGARELNVEPWVRFTGFITPPPGVVFRDVADIAVSPSRAEGFGLTVIEAGAAGCPVVATDTTGMREILTDGENGLVVPIENPEALGQALLRLVDDAALRRRFAERLRDTVRERFSITRYVGDFEALYERWLERPSKQLGWSQHIWKGEGGMYLRWLGGMVSRRLGRAPKPLIAAAPAS
jgi:glycosyltransferase involved in cell wall biosynthesis